ncbi:MAG: hypothetical protein H7096_00035 [Flavobacterium sp.]|nr:hypothetical protein [Pedobacter sp.]
MKNSFVITGDIIGFTRVTEGKRKKLIESSRDLFASWVGIKQAQIFRGDSFQLLFDMAPEALKRCIQIRCWFKMFKISEKVMLDARMSIGVGQIAYRGKSVLDSDGEAFHISGRIFDNLEQDELIKIVTSDEKLNEQLYIICRLMDVIITGWTRNQAEVIFLVLENRTQQQMADKLQIVQSAINNRIKLSKWKEIEKAIHYISTLI